MAMIRADQMPSLSLGLPSLVTSDTEYESSAFVADHPTSFVMGSVARSSDRPS